MRVIRLSRVVVPSHPRKSEQRSIAEPQDGTFQRKTLSIPILILIRVLTTFLLLCAIGLTLLVLLLPTPRLHLSALTIHPNDKSLGITQASPIAGLNTTGLTNVTQSEGSSGKVNGVELRSFGVEVDTVQGDMTREKRVLGDGNRRDDEWLGLYGPSIWLGVMRKSFQMPIRGTKSFRLEVCSRSSPGTPISCTSVSNPSPR
jgi:hypothetical protein